MQVSHQVQARLADANVLIHFLEADEQILRVSSTAVAPIKVPLPVFNEVKHLTEARCKKLSLEIELGTTDQLLEAAANRGALSFADWTCWILARDHSYVVLTADGPLRDKCQAHGTSTLRTFDVLVELVERNLLRAAAACAVAKRIRDRNEKFIPFEALLELEGRVKAIENERRSKKPPN